MVSGTLLMINYLSCYKQDYWEATSFQQMVVWLSVECKIQGSKVGVVVVLRLISREAK